MMSLLLNRARSLGVLGGVAVDHVRLDKPGHDVRHLRPARVLRGQCVQDGDQAPQVLAVDQDAIANLVGVFLLRRLAQT